MDRSKKYKSLNEILLSEDFLLKLFPKGVFENDMCKIGNVNGDPGKSLCVSLGTGRWIDFAAGDKGGDLISLYAAANALSQNDAYNKLVEIYGLPSERSAPKAPKAPKIKNTNNRDIANALWDQSVSIDGTLAQNYLKRRSIEIQHSESLRFNGKVFNKELNISLPAMIGCVRDSENKILAVHRTYLDNNTALKANVKSPKMILGAIEGGACQLAEAEETIVICEGIETALSLLQETKLPVWAALSSSNLPNLELPLLPLAKKIIIAADSDGAGIAAAKKAADLWTIGGREVTIALPPSGMDFNDILCNEPKQINHIIKSSKQYVSDPPIPLIEYKKEVSVYPIEALGETLGNAAKAIERKIQAPTEICAQSVLAVATLSVQCLAEVMLPIGQKKPISEYFVTIAKSGERKSSCDSEALIPVSELEKELHEDYETQFASWKNQHDAWDANRKKITKIGKDSTNEDMTYELDNLGLEPDAPKNPLLFCSDLTFEGLCKHFMNGHNGIGIFSDEGSQILSGHSMKEENRVATTGAFCNLWDAKPIKRLRVTDSTVMLEEKKATLHIMIQPSVAETLLSDERLSNQGLLSRILFSAPASKIGKRVVTKPHNSIEAEIKKYSETIKRNLRLSIESKKTKPLEFTDSAAAIWFDYANEVESHLGENGKYSSICNFANKLPEHSARIAAILTLIDNPNAETISDEVFCNAKNLTEYYASEALRLNEEMKVDPDIVLAHKLLDWLNNDWDAPYISPPNIYQTLNWLKCAKKAKKIISILEEHKWLTKMPKPMIVNGQKRNDVWRINNF